MTHNEDYREPRRRAVNLQILRKSFRWYIQKRTSQKLSMTPKPYAIGWNVGLIAPDISHPR
jgi:hypothetical protein